MNRTLFLKMIIFYFKVALIFSVCLERPIIFMELPA